jgi:hypothetical protein
LVQLVQSNELFDRWCGYKSNNKKVSPVELLVLGSLRYLGRGWTFDAIEESTVIDKEVHRCFLKVFIQFGSTASCMPWTSLKIRSSHTRHQSHPSLGLRKNLQYRFIDIRRNARFVYWPVLA